MTLKSYGIPQVDDDPESDMMVALQELERNGFTILPAMVSPTMVAGMRMSLDGLLARQTARCGGEDSLTAIGEAGQARALLEEEPIFLEILRLPLLDSIVEAILGPAALVMQQNGVVMPPQSADHHQQSWHRDLPYQNWVSSKPIAIGALTILDDFTPQSGATSFLPGSHRHEGFPGRSYVTRWAHQVTAPSGSLVVFDAMCYHAGGVNTGSSPRRAVNTLFGVPLLAQQVSFTPKPGIDAKLLRRLGIDYQPARSADEWRAKRQSRLGRKQ